MFEVRLCGLNTSSGAQFSGSEIEHCGVITGFQLREGTLGTHWVTVVDMKELASEYKVRCIMHKHRTPVDRTTSHAEAGQEHGRAYSAEENGPKDCML